MQIMPPVLMPIWMVIVMIVGILLVSAWLLRTFLVTRRDTSLEVGDIPMAPGERRQWGERLTEIAQRWDGGELDLRDLHLELAALLRGFAEARSGEEITTATVSTWPLPPVHARWRSVGAVCVRRAALSTPTRWGILESCSPCGSSPPSIVSRRPPRKRPLLTHGR